VGRAGPRGDRGRVDLDYLDHLRVERALSPNTLEAYGRDLARLTDHAQKAKRSLLDLRQSDLTNFIGSLREEGLSARSVARAVHALRGFFRFAVREGRLESDPMENLRAPRAFAALPRYLTPAQVETLLAAPDVETTLGLRDRAILEVLYATGLRVSELTALRDRDLDLEVGILTCFGKGRKERLVPMGGEARRWVVRYRDDARPELAGSAGAPGCSSTTAADGSPHGTLGHRAPARGDGGRAGDADAARPPPFLRDPSARRGGPARAAGHAGPRGHLDHADLHAHHARAAAQGL
jgi:integrase/recombinase XerD